MNLKTLILTGLILIALSGIVNAGHGSSSGYSFDGNGSPIYPNEGMMWAEMWAEYSDVGGMYHQDTDVYVTGGHSMYYHYYADLTICSSGQYGESIAREGTTTSNNVFYYLSRSSSGCTSGTGTKTIYSSINHRIARAAVFDTSGYTQPGESGSAFVRMTVTAGNIYNLSGTTECLTSVSLYDERDILIDTDALGDNDYMFYNLIDNKTYTIIFNDAHEYEFTVNGSDIVYDYDDCTHTQYRFKEKCGNLIPDSEGLYIENDGVIVLAIEDFYTSDGILDIGNSTADHIYIYADTFIGRTGWVIDPVVADTQYTLTNPNIAWGLKVIVVNDSDGSLIDDAMVKVDQTCYCTDGYSTRQKMTVAGTVGFTDMSLQDASLFVMKSGYKIVDENTTGYDVFLSGRTNFSSKTWLVKLAPSWSNNTSEWFEVQYKTDIHFKDTGGNRTSQIRDTDAYVDLYYENNNSNEEAMTLKFQSSSTHTYFIDEDSWSIAHDDIGYKRITTGYFTPYTYAYRAVIYNSSIYGWNITIPLTVRNGTKEETLHYENLTTNLWFRHEKDGRIDYREDMQIVSHAQSNNTTLMNIDLELWKGGALLCYKNMTDTDYSGATYPYFYMWEPVYDYVPGSNYTTKMYGFDRTLLEVRYLDCINDTVTRKNKLTIGVKDRFGNNLDNCYIYLEGWGSLPTGTTYYNAYEGIGNGDYRYKATKSGYSGSGWSDVILSDSDKTVWYTLTEDLTNVSATQQKLTDDDVKGLFFPLMFFLLICIIFGGFKYVAD
jgi:hypothetical protein